MEFLNFLRDDPAMAGLAAVGLMIIILPIGALLWRRISGRPADVSIKQSAASAKPTRFGNRTELTLLFVGLLLLISVGAVVWPFIVGPGEMEGFCSTLEVGSSIAPIQAQAAQHGYRVSPLIDGRAFVLESRSFGRFTCALQFESDGLVSADYSFND